MDEGTGAEPEYPMIVQDKENSSNKSHHDVFFFFTIQSEKRELIMYTSHGHITCM